MVIPADMSTTTQTSQTDGGVQGTPLREYSVAGKPWAIFVSLKTLNAPSFLPPFRSVWIPFGRSKGSKFRCGSVQKNIGNTQWNDPKCMLFETRVLHKCATYQRKSALRKNAYFFEITSLLIFALCFPTSTARSSKRRAKGLEIRVLGTSWNIFLVCRRREIFGSG